VTKLGPILEDIHSRLAGVVIECLPWREFIDRYDTAGTLFYLDPPYWGSEDDYGAGAFTRADFVGLATRLDRRQVHPVGQRRSRNPRDLPPLRDRDGRDALHRVRQVV
jgi:site-specific DNA-adenine methylase